MLALWLAHQVLATHGWRQWSCMPPHHGHGQFKQVLPGAEVHAPGGLQSPLFSTWVGMWCYWVQPGPLWDLESPSRCHSQHPRLSVFSLRRSSYSTLVTQTSNWNNPALIGPDRGWSSSGAAVFLHVLVLLGWHQLGRALQIMFCQAVFFFVQFFGCPLEVSEASVQDCPGFDKRIRTVHHKPFSVVGVPILGFLWQPTQWPRFSQLIQNRLGRETRPNAIEFGCHMAEMAWSVWYLRAQQNLRPNCTGVLWRRKKNGAVLAVYLPIVQSGWWSRWCQLKHFLEFSPQTLGEDSNPIWRLHIFQRGGLVQPPSRGLKPLEVQLLRPKGVQPSRSERESGKVRKEVFEEILLMEEILHQLIW